MKKFKILVPVLALTLLGTSALAVNDAHARGCPYAHENMEGIKITDEQRDAARSLVEASEKKTGPLKDKMFIKKQELKALQNASNPDVQAVTKTSTELVELRNQVRAEKDKLGLELDKALGLPPGTHAFKDYGIGEGRGHGKGHGKGHGMKGEHGKGRGMHEKRGNHENHMQDDKI